MVKWTIGPDLAFKQRIALLDQAVEFEDPRAQDKGMFQNPVQKAGIGEGFDRAIGGASGHVEAAGHRFDRNAFGVVKQVQHAGKMRDRTATGQHAGFVKSEKNGAQYSRFGQENKCNSQ